MRHSVLVVFWSVLSLAIAPATIAVADIGDQPLPVALNRDIDFHQEVVPILYRSCVKCHSGKEPKGGFGLDTRAKLLKGGDSGAVVIPGKSADSLLIQLVAGHDEDRIMPAQGPRLKAEQVALLRAWIDRGVSWEEGFTFAPTRQAPLEPRRPELPTLTDSSPSTNPIDRLLQPYFEQTGFTPAGPVSDREFARRVFLDIVGLLPSPTELAAFEQNESPGKRADLVRQLLDNRQAYAEHWLTFWNDALRNAFRGTGYIDGGRKSITGWLYEALYENKPYDRFVYELLNPTSESEGFIRGIVWRGVVNASQRREMQAAQNLSQVFMGTSLKCASCHDSFVNDWKLTDAYGLAAVFADEQLEIHRCDKPTGEFAAVKFIYPQLGTIDPQASKDKRLQQLADAMTSPQNGRLTRMIVNRLWAWHFGRGIVEPVGDLDQEPWRQDLLDWLAVDLADHNFDLKHTIALMCTSQAYQLPSVGMPRPEDTDFEFRGPLVKRMTAEQFVDAVATLTGDWPNQPATAFPVRLPAEFDPSRVLYDSGVLREGSAEIDIDIQGKTALQLIVTDAGDGNSSDWAVWAEPRLESPVEPQSPKSRRLTDSSWRSAVSSFGSVALGKNVANKPLRVAGRAVKAGIGTHADAVITYDLPAGYTRFKATIGPDTAALEQGKGATSLRFLVLSQDTVPRIGVRTALVNDDALTRALGRPNREQVILQRDTLTTTLQALELTNGTTLDRMLNVGAERWLSRYRRQSPEQLVDALYLEALGRHPEPEEQAAGLELVGSTLTTEGITDLLWVLTMLPEFQLIQ